MISLTLMTGEYERLVADYEPYLRRQVEALVADELEHTEIEPEPAAALAADKLEETKTEPESAAAPVA